jgi:hypothetical protein
MNTKQIRTTENTNTTRKKTTRKKNTKKKKPQSHKPELKKKKLPGLWHGFHGEQNKHRGTFLKRYSGIFPPKNHEKLVRLSDSETLQRTNTPVISLLFF